MSFKDVKETTAAEVIRKITEVVQAETIRLSPWWEDAPIEIQFRRKLDSLRDGVPTSAELSMSLQTITHVLAKVSGHPPLVLIEEYDTPNHLRSRAWIFPQACPCAHSQDSE